MSFNSCYFTRLFIQINLSVRRVPPFANIFIPLVASHTQLFTSLFIRKTCEYIHQRQKHYYTMKQELYTHAINQQEALFTLYLTRLKKTRHVFFIHTFYIYALYVDDKYVDGKYQTRERERCESLT